MRLHRFYIPKGNLGDYFLSKKDFILSDERLLHQLFSVFRFKAGQEIILFDGTGFDFLCEIKDNNAHASRKKVPVKVKEKIKNIFTPRKKITLFQSLIKKDNFELVAEKATELGVTKIVPVISERSEKKALNMERIKKIIIEATEQSGKDKLPEICAPVSIKDSFQKTAPPTIVFDPSGQPFHKFEGILEVAGEEQLSIFIGPEGGWSKSELNVFRKNGAEIFSLGQQILRAETAAIAAVSVLLL